MTPSNNRNKHYKKIGTKRYIRIFLRKLFFLTFLITLISITALTVYDKEFVGIIFDKYINDFSKKINFSLKKIELQEQLKYCPSITNLLDDIKPDTSIFLISITDIKTKLESLDCIASVKIERKYPDTIKIQVYEKQPIAIWQNEQNFYYITENGSIMFIRKLKNIEKFIIIAGSNAPIHTPDLISFLALDRELMSEVVSAIWVGNRRWNINLENGMLVKLPESNPEIAWNKFIKIINNIEFKEKKYKSVDLRIQDRVYATE